MKAKMTDDLQAVHPEDWPNGIIPKGTVIEKDDIWKLVRAGQADPADEECRIAAGMDDAEIKLAKYRQRRQAAGISHEDIDAYDQGLMVGYDEDGKWIPGPNATTDSPESEYADDDDFDDEEYDEDPVAETETESDHG